MFDKSKLFIYFVGFAGIILSMILYTVIVDSEQEKITDKFNQNANKIHKIFISTTNQNINTVNFISSIFSNLEVPTRKEFKKIVDTAINFNGVTTGISWNPYFKYNERIEYEQMAKKDGLNDFNFIGINKDGKKGISEKKDDYVAVFYIEPFEKNKGALGFDISSNKTRLQTINETKDSGNIAITDRINLVQKDKKTYGALALQAIYKKDSLTNTIEQRRENFKGVIVGVFSFYELGQVSTFKK